MDSIWYCGVLKGRLLVFAAVDHRERFLFLEDNPAAHRSKYTLSWLTARNIQVMQWTLRSPDLSPIENKQDLLESNVYESGKQYMDIAADTPFS